MIGFTVCLCFNITVFVFSVVYVYVFFFFKQKTAYDMRISDWSSDVCSSDLAGAIAVEKLKLLGIGQTIAQPSVDIGLEHRNIVKNLARCQNPVRDGGDGRRLDVELDFRLWLCRRSEEHTSELQSLMRISYAVFCLQKKIDHFITIHQ